MTKSDMEIFVKERSPHVISVEVDDESNDEFSIVKIKLNFWYRFWYERQFYNFITALIDEYKMYGVNYDVVIVS